MTQAHLKNKLNKTSTEAQAVKKVKKDKKKKANARLNALMTNINKAFECDNPIRLYTTASVLRDHLSYIFKQEYPEHSLN